MNAVTARALAKLYERQAEMCEQAAEIESEIATLSSNGFTPSTMTRKQRKTKGPAAKSAKSKSGKKSGKRGRPPGSKNKSTKASVAKTKASANADSNGESNGESNGKKRSRAVNDKLSHVIAYECIKKNGKVELKQVTQALIDAGWKTTSKKKNARSAAAYQAVMKLYKPSTGPALVGKKGHDYFLTAAGKKAGSAMEKIA